MKTSEEMVTITKERFDDLIDSERMLICLQNAGVDNWEWYDEAMEEYRSEDE